MAINLIYITAVFVTTCVNNKFIYVGLHNRYFVLVAHKHKYLLGLYLNMQCLKQNEGRYKLKRKHMF